MKAIRSISIISGRPEDSGRRIKVSLFRDGKVFRWFGGTPGEFPAAIAAQDTEVSGASIADACEKARRAWAGSGWGLRAKSSNF